MTVIVASNSVQYSDDTEYQTASYAVPVKLSELTVTDLYTGSWRIYFEMINYEIDGSAWVQIYKNGTAYGTLQESPGGDYSSRSEDFTSINITSGDKIQLYGYLDEVAGYGTTRVKNFRIEFDLPSTAALHYMAVN